MATDLIFKMVPVSEALPDYGTSVLVRDRAWAFGVCYRNHTDASGEHWFMAGDAATDDTEFHEVTHWAELPHMWEEQYG
jgi:hypothetical protein